MRSEIQTVEGAGKGCTELESARKVRVVFLLHVGFEGQYPPLRSVRSTAHCRVQELGKRGERAREQASVDMVSTDPPI